jgi:hypothetical protein
MAALPRVPGRITGGAGQEQRAVRAGGTPVRGQHPDPWVKFANGDRKIDVIRPYLDAAERAEQPRVFVGSGKPASSSGSLMPRNSRPGRSVWFRFYRTERLVTCFCCCIWEERCGPGFIKICSYAPYPVKVRLNGDDIARRKAIAAGLEVTPLVGYGPHRTAVRPRSGPAQRTMRRRRRQWVPAAPRRLRGGREPGRPRQPEFLGQPHGLAPAVGEEPRDRRPHP